MPASTQQYQWEGSAQGSAQNGRESEEMAKLIREDGGGHRQVRRPDGRTDQFARAPRWRIRYGLLYPDGSRVIRSKMTGRRTDATLLRGEASRLERLTRTATATQQDLGHLLRLSDDENVLGIGVSVQEQAGEAFGRWMSGGTTVLNETVYVPQNSSQ